MASAIIAVTVTGLSEVVGTTRRAGRAIRPIAASMDANSTARAITSPGVAAVSDVDGIANCGAGPGFGPTANVYAPRTGWPSCDTTRQNTRYQPGCSVRSGTTSVVPHGRVGGPDVTCWPLGSVTETIANRGSTGSV